MYMCTQKQRSVSPDQSVDKENISIFRANSFNSKDCKMEKKLAERESMECCLWLIAAGFPQYVHMFEEGRLPIQFNLSDLSRDHEFLETSSLKSLLKRLEVLNECSTHNIHSSRLLNSNTAGGHLKPLSRVWQYHETSNSWSRRDSKLRDSSKIHLNVSDSTYSIKARSMDFLSQTGSADCLTPLKLKSPVPRPPYSADKSVSTTSLSTVAYTDSIVFQETVVKTRNTSTTPRRSTERRPRTLPPNCATLLSPSLSFNFQSDSSLNTSSKSNKFNKSNSSLTPGHEVSQSNTSYYSCSDSVPISGSADSLKYNNIRAVVQPSNGIGVEECTSSGSSMDTVSQSNSILNGVYERVNGGDNTSPDTLTNQIPSFDPTFNARAQVAMATEGMSSPLPGSQTVMRPQPVTRRVREYRWEASVTKEMESTSCQPIHELSVNQMVILNKLSLLKLTDLIETHTSSTKARLSLSQLVSNSKPYKQHQHKSNRIFGVSLTEVLEQTGQCVPQVILSAMKYILEEGNDCVGIFRTCAAKSKLDALKAQCESNCRLDFSTTAPYEAAALIKHYFRELPEPLITYKLSNILLCIFTSFPVSVRIEATQCVMLLLPDSNREALHSLLYFLQGISMSKLINKMDAYNLAVCFAPTLFAFTSQEWAPNKRSRVKCGSYFPTTSDLMNTKEIIQSKACTECLTALISNSHSIFMVPSDLLKRCESADIQLSSLPTSPSCLNKDHLVDSPSFSTRLHSEYKSIITNKVQLMLLDSSSKKSGWKLYKSGDGVELSHRSTNDSLIPLWRAVTSVHTSQECLLKRVLEERNMWDEDIARWQVIPLDHQTEVFRYATHSMYGPHPPREYCVIRSWHLDTCSGSVVLHSMSIREKKQQNWTDLTSIQGDLLNETFIIQKITQTECRLILFSQIDTRGRSPDFYLHYGPYILNSVILLRKSFRNKTQRNCIETRV